MESNYSFAKEIKEVSYTLGFSHCGITDTKPLLKAEARFQQWISSNHHAEMGYLERTASTRFRPDLQLEGANSIIVLAFPYGHGEVAQKNTTGVAMYAWGEDYHIKLKTLSRSLIELIEKKYPNSRNRFFVDSGALPERSLAVKAGIGWIGKNGTLITENRGSMCYLAEILTTVKLPIDSPYPEQHCGACTKCIDSCPTGAIISPPLIDARRCISWNTNTSKKAIPVDIASKLGGRIYGCDICQQVCPWNQEKLFHSKKFTLVNFYPKHWPSTPDDWHGLSEERFNELFRNTTIWHTGFKKLRDNIESAYSSLSNSSPQANESN